MNLNITNFDKFSCELLSKSRNMWICKMTIIKKFMEILINIGFCIKLFCSFEIVKFTKPADKSLWLISDFTVKSGNAFEQPAEF